MNRITKFLVVLMTLCALCSGVKTAHATVQPFKLSPPINNLGPSYDFYTRYTHTESFAVQLHHWQAPIDDWTCVVSITATSTGNSTILRGSCSFAANRSPQDRITFTYSCALTASDKYLISGDHITIADVLVTGKITSAGGRFAKAVGTTATFRISSYPTFSSTFDY